MEQVKKRKSRDAARQRRGQQNDEFSELAAQLPLPLSVTEKLDRLCVMRLANSYIKIKHVLHQLHGPQTDVFFNKMDAFTSELQDALGGFVFVLAEDGQCLYVSPNISDNLGLQQLDVTGHSMYKYVHPCDQENLATQLGGQVPLEDMEIFDGLFCGDNLNKIKNPKQAVSEDLEESPHRSFFLRMKSTLTSRGKSVNINASIYRVVHCTGTIQTYLTSLGSSEGSTTRCLLAIGNPLLSNATFEVPVDRQTFITKHTLDMKITEMEELAGDIIGYQPESMVGSSWYFYSHICDANVLKNCHDTVLKKGQAVSGYYRVLVKTGGWVWMQTKANVVYSAANGQPQYIVCVHYVISGLELEDQMLSTEQMTATAAKAILKRTETTEDEQTAQIKVVTAPVYSKANDNYGFTSEAISFQTKSEEELLREIDDSDMPGLEFLDVTEDLQDFIGYSSRSPFIPPPFIDTDLCASNIDGDLASIIEESELVNRAPYIPPPCIDKIVSFDDLDEYNFDGGYDDVCNNSKTKPPMMDSAWLVNSAPAMNQFYNMESAQAKVPYYLIAKQTQK